MNKHSADVVFVSNHFDAHGTVITGSGRILDVLNDPTTRFLKLDDARICPRNTESAIVELRNTVLAKESIHLVQLVGEDRSNETKVFFAAQARKTIDVVLTLPTILVEGRIHVKSAHDPQAYLTLEAGAFFPVTAARLHDESCVESRPVQSVILVNKQHVSSLAFRSA